MNFLQRKLGLNFWILVLASLVLLPACEQQINFPKPVAEVDVSHDEAGGDTGLLLTVMGSSFSPGSLVEWNGTPLLTNFLDRCHMTT